MAHVYERNFVALGKILDLDAVQESAIESGKSRQDGYMDWTLDVLTKDPEGRTIIAIAHRYEQNGDLVPDPDMELRIDFERKTVEAMTFKNSFGLQEVYPAPKVWRPKMSKELNSFLETWLRNLRYQGHRIGRPEGNRKHFETSPSAAA